MPQDSSSDLSITVGAIVVEEGGAMSADVVTTDYESFSSSLVILRNIEEQVVDAESEEFYGGSFWLLDLDRSANGSIFAGDADGNVHTNASGEWTVESVSPGFGIRVVRCLPDHTVFAAGSEGIVYVRTPDGWAAASANFGQWITGLDGRTASDLVIAGDSGLVAQFDGTNWTRIELPTDVTFHAVLSFENEYYVCGASGALFSGSGLVWQDRTSLRSDLHGITNYDGEIWLACGSDGAGRLGPNGLEIVLNTFAAYSVHSAGHYLGFAGNGSVVRFDGTNWHGRRYG